MELLIIDDEPNILVTLKAKLRKLYQITTAESGDVGLEIMRKEPERFHLILCDEKMPGMPGHEFASTIQDSPEFKHVFIIILSGVSGVIDVDGIQKALNWGQIYGLLCKPWNDAELYSLLNNARNQYETIAELERRALYDGLTKVFNRVTIEEVLNREIQRVERNEQPLSMILLDVDHFKKVNDQYGHDVGDDVLVTLAEVVGETIRKVDVLGRWGGEEFAVILPNTTSIGAWQMAEKIRKNIADYKFPRVGKVTVSLGVTSLQSIEDTGATLYKRTDEALYKAKDGGRNRSELLPVKKLLPTHLLNSVCIENIRCFEDLFLDLSGEGSLWNLFLGDNATGKTTILRSIAMGLCDETRAISLMKKVPGPLIRDGQTSGKITLKLVSDGKEKTITTLIVKIDHRETLAKVPKYFPWENIFVCGYGIHRSTSHTISTDRYELDQALKTLFGEDTMQNPEVVLLRQEGSFRIELREKLLHLLMLDPKNHEIELGKNGIEVTGPWGKKNLEVLSDGYRSTFKWLVDLFGWAIHAKRIDDFGDIEGIVLIDELEQHLHPHWQRQIVHLLKQQFPKIQFFATTHSPIIATSVGQISDESSKESVFHLGMEEDGSVRVRKVEESLKTLNVDQVLASYAFDYMIDRDPEVEAILKTASELAGKGETRTQAEEKRYQAIKAELKKILYNMDTTLIERDARQEFRREIKAQVKELEKKLGLS